MIRVAVGRLRGKVFLYALPLVLVSVAIWTSATAHGQMLYSFENDLEGFFLPDGGGGISLAQSTIGATDGLQSMAVEVDSEWNWNTRVYPPNGEAVYNAFNAVAADLSAYTIDLDITFASDSWANVTVDEPWFQINLAVNSDMGWQQFGGALQRPTEVAGTFPVSLPMVNLPVAQDSSWYELNIGSNARHTLGPSGEGVVYYVDNIRFSRIPEFTEDLIFSWETPDDPGTPDVDERLEGWISEWDGGGGHNHSISTTGATDGDYALQFDRTGTTAFMWGSKVEFSGGEGTPEQDTIDDLVQRIESADRLAFDITLTDQFPASPTWLKFAVAISDNAGGWFQSPEFSVDPTVIEATTFTYDIGLDQFTSGGADFNVDGKVDGDDFLIWQTGFGITSGATLSDGDADDDGDVDGDDFLLWQSNFGTGGSLADVGLAEGTDFLGIHISSNTDDGGIYQIDNFRLLTEVVSLTAVPEPSSAMLVALVGWLVWLIRRPCRRG